MSLTRRLWQWWWKTATRRGKLRRNYTPHLDCLEARDVPAGRGGTVGSPPVATPPSFLKGPDITVREDAPAFNQSWATKISSAAGAFEVSNNNPGLFAEQPSISATGFLPFKVAPDVPGTATVSVKLRVPGVTETSVTQTFTINVLPVNDQPNFKPGPDVTALQTAGTQSVAWASNMRVGPPNESSQSWYFVVFANDNPDLFISQPAIDKDGILTYTTSPSKFGLARLKVKMVDTGGVLNGGIDTSPTYDFVIAVGEVNRPPSFNILASNIVLPEDAPPQLLPFAADIKAGLNESTDVQALEFLVTNTNPALFKVQPTIDAKSGKLSFAGAPDAFGTAIVTAQLRDDTGTKNGGQNTSPTATFSITFSPINDIPSFTPGANPTVLEDAGLQSLPYASNPSAGPANESSQTLIYTVTQTGATGGLTFDVAPAINPTTGDLTFRTAANANGTATFKVSLIDDGLGTAPNVNTSTPQTLTITVTPVNDSPGFTSGGNQTAAHDAGAQTVQWASAITAGPANETGPVNFIVSSDNASIFDSPPSISPTGMLSYAPAVGAAGTALVTVQLHDPHGGNDTSAAQTFTITVIGPPPPAPPAGNNDTPPPVDQGTNNTPLTPPPAGNGTTATTGSTSPAPVEVSVLEVRPEDVIPLLQPALVALFENNPTLKAKFDQGLGSAPDILGPGAESFSPTYALAISAMQGKQGQLLADIIDQQRTRDLVFSAPGDNSADLAALNAVLQELVKSEQIVEIQLALMRYYQVLVATTAPLSERQLQDRNKARVLFETMEVGSPIARRTPIDATALQNVVNDHGIAHAEANSAAGKVLLHAWQGAYSVPLVLRGNAALEATASVVAIDLSKTNDLTLGVGGIVRLANPNATVTIYGYFGEDEISATTVRNGEAFTVLHLNGLTSIVLVPSVESGMTLSGLEVISRRDLMQSIAAVVDLATNYRVAIASANAPAFDNGSSWWWKRKVTNNGYGINSEYGYYMPLNQGKYNLVQLSSGEGNARFTGSFVSIKSVPNDAYPRSTPLDPARYILLSPQVLLVFPGAPGVIWVRLHTPSPFRMSNKEGNSMREVMPPSGAASLNGGMVDRRHNGSDRWAPHVEIRSGQIQNAIGPFHMLATFHNNGLSAVNIQQVRVRSGPTSSLADPLVHTFSGTTILPGQDIDLHIGVPQGQAVGNQKARWTISFVIDGIERAMSSGTYREAHAIDPKSVLVKDKDGNDQLPDYLKRSLNRIIGHTGGHEINVSIGPNTYRLNDKGEFSIAPKGDGAPIPLTQLPPDARKAFLHDFLSGDLRSDLIGVLVTRYQDHGRDLSMATQMANAILTSAANNPQLLLDTLDLAPLDRAEPDIKAFVNMVARTLVPDATPRAAPVAPPSLFDDNSPVLVVSRDVLHFAANSPSSVMLPIRHVVAAGESLSSIATKFHLAGWRSIYDDPNNTEFRKLRPDPNKIQVGDVVFVPVSAEHLQKIVEEFSQLASDWNSQLTQLTGDGSSLKVNGLSSPELSEAEALALLQKAQDNLRQLLENKTSSNRTLLYTETIDLTAELLAKEVSKAARDLTNASSSMILREGGKTVKLVGKISASMTRIQALHDVITALNDPKVSAEFKAATITVSAAEVLLTLAKGSTKLVGRFFIWLEITQPTIERMMNPPWINSPPISA